MSVSGMLSQHEQVPSFGPSTPPQHDDVQPAASASAPTLPPRPTDDMEMWVELEPPQLPEAPSAIDDWNAAWEILLD